jgi:oligopeptidase B
MVTGGAVPPAAPREPSIRLVHGVATPDPYAWMRNRTDPRLIAYLREERAHYEEATARLEPLRAVLRSELERRLPAREDSIPWQRGPHSYFWRTPAGTEHAVLCRPGEAGHTYVVLDTAALAGSSTHFRYGVCEPSPDGGLVAYSVDLTGDELYELRFRDPASGADLEEHIPHTSYGCAWSSDSTSFFYVVPDAAYRPCRVLRHEVGTDPGRDVVVYSEADERFHVSVGATRSGCWIVISSGSRDTSEQWLIPATDPTSPARCVEGRRRGVEYFLEHLLPLEPGGEEAFVILTNDSAPEYRVVAAPIDRPVSELWRTVVPGSDDTRLHTLDTFAGHLVIHCRRDATEFLTVVRPDRSSYEVHPDAPAGMIEVDCGDACRTAQAVVATESLVTPRRWWSLDLPTGERKLLREQAVPGHRPGDYAVEQLRTRAPDGTLVRVTIAYRSGLPADGTSPCLLHGYGAYENCAARGFSVGLPSLLDRGFVYAIAHVRGGGECGRRWWLDGRLAAKHHTFTDFVAARDLLVAERRVAGDKVVCRGLSAGGLLTGAAYTFWPDRWAGVIAEAPAVDLLNQMLDPSVPLTVNEYDEWGDPADPVQFAWMRAYTPYENVTAAPRPPLLVTGILSDPRVMVYVPARWVAALRAADVHGNEILFRAELGAGAHHGPSGRRGSLAYEAELCAWVIDVADRPRLVPTRGAGTG